MAGARELAAQGPLVFEGFAARKGLSSDPLFGGAALSAYSGPFGLRLGGGLHLADSQGSYPVPLGDPYPFGRPCRPFECPPPFRDSRGLDVGAWTADADLIFAPLRSVPVARALLLGFSPYGFAGIGRYSTQPNNGRDTTLTTVSYGVGAQHNLLGWLGVGAEARYRRSLGSDSAIAVGSPRAWEYRLAFTISFGGPHPATTRPAGNVRPSVRDQPAERVASDEESAARRAARVLDLAESYLDTPYRRGGTTPTGGFDAAGFVQYVYAQQGIRLPGTSRRIAEVGTEVSTRIGALRPGDLLFFANEGSSVDHVAIYAGHERIVHSSASGGGVRYDILGEGERGQWFADHLVTARRLLRDDSGRPMRDGDEPDPPDRAPRASRAGDTR
jgi:cell wall-associated NlpC family hydrolase